MGGFGLPFFYSYIMTTPTTVDTDTDLSAVNSILGAIGQSPLTELNYTNPEVGFIFNILTEVNKDVQNEGWIFNTEYKVEVSPDSNKHIVIPANVLKYDKNGDHHDRRTNFVRRAGNLYDTLAAVPKDEFDDSVFLDIVWLFPFTQLPSAFQRYVIARASVRAATQLVSNPQLVQLLQTQEAQARATCMEYECQQGDHSFMGFPDKSIYSTYQPYIALAR